MDNNLPELNLKSLSSLNYCPRNVNIGSFNFNVFSIIL